MVLLADENHVLVWFTLGARLGGRRAESARAEPELGSVPCPCLGIVLEGLCFCCAESGSVFLFRVEVVGLLMRKGDAREGVER